MFHSSGINVYAHSGRSSIINTVTKRVRRAVIHNGKMVSVPLTMVEIAERLRVSTEKFFERLS